MAPAVPDPQPVKQLIIAVHGIGDQVRFATAKQVLTQFGRYHGKTAAVPLGHFHPTDPKKPGVVIAEHLKQLEGFGFTEVYWADVPRAVVDKKYLLEDIGPWIETVSGRIAQSPETNPDLTEADVNRVQQVLREMVQTIAVLDRLLFLAKKMGIFSFDLKAVLENFVYDVQVVAEFKNEGGQIGALFASHLANVCTAFPDADEIHLIAHSEGTVVTLLGLLAAASDPGCAWLGKVRGLMTIGSPLDKHLTLWPELFAQVGTPRNFPRSPIVWHNYYDYGDPVGFDLDMVRKRFATGDWSKVFEFPAQNDHGFARFPLPGKAHNDYWRDVDVFGHFISNVVERRVPRETADAQRPADPVARFPAPQSKPLAQAISWSLPYVAAIALVFSGVLVLFKAVNGLLHANDTEVVDAPLLETFGWVMGITCLLAGLTVAARIPRLTRLKSWWAFGYFFFVAMLALYRTLFCITPKAGGFRACVDRTASAALQNPGLVGIAIGTLGLTLLVRFLWPDWSMRALLIPGALGVAYGVVRAIGRAKPEHLGDLWPVFVAGTVFFYLWWLVALLFDLTFVWHRYIRLSTWFLKKPERATGQVTV